MNLETREQGGAVIVGLGGEIDLQHSPRLRKMLMDLMVERRNVVIDMSDVAYIDSSGIASLVEAYQMARRHGGRFTFARISPPAMRVLQLARLDKVFAIADSIEAAVKQA